MNIVFIIPTGIGCEIGGHAGDATPAAKLIASLCNKLYSHPNVFNASDINEMPENSLYIEGSILDRFLFGQIFLDEVSYNRILLVVNKPVRNETINAVNAARSTIGADIQILELETPLEMEGKIVNNRATGEVRGWEPLVYQVNNYDFDALAIASPIEVDRETRFNYFKNGGVNPWGGIEAITSRLIAEKLDKPTAHSPVHVCGQDIEYDNLHENLVSDPRIAAEMVSVCYLHCILKGLHKAPRINYKRGLSVDDIDFMVSPMCFGEPHLACVKAQIPIIYVKENETAIKFTLPDNVIVAENYWEAAGIISCFKAGITKESIRRPLVSVNILKTYEYEYKEVYERIRN